MADKLLSEFKDWSDRNGTHLNRHISIIDRQAKNLREYVDLFSKYPANSIEFKSEVEKLLSELGLLAEEMKEVSDSLAQDCDDFRIVMTSLKKNILNGWKDE